MISFFNSFNCEVVHEHVHERTLHTISLLRKEIPTPPSKECGEAIIPSSTYSQNTFYTEKTFNLISPDASCHAILVETRYTLAPPLIYATQITGTNETGTRSFGVGRLLIYSSSSIPTEFAIKIHSVRSTPISWSWRYITRVPALSEDNGLIEFSQEKKWIASHEGYHIVHSDCYLHISPSTETTLLSDFYGDIKMRSMSYLKKGEEITLRYDLYDRRNIYRIPKCSYSVYHVEASSTHIPSLSSLNQGKIVRWISSSIVELEVNNTLTATSAYGDLPHISDQIIYPNLSLAIDTNGTFAEKARLAGIHGSPCLGSFLPQREKSFLLCHNMIYKRCSYDSQCPGSTCDDSTNRCRYTSTAILNCYLSSFSIGEKERIQAFHGITDLTTHATQLITPLTDGIERSISYKIDQGCVDACPSIFVSTLLEDDHCNCPRIHLNNIKLLSYGIKQCKIKGVDCDNTTVSYCTSCNGPYCERTGFEDYCVNWCYHGSFNLATKADCESYINAFRAPQIINGLVVSTNISCDKGQSLSFTSCEENSPLTSTGGNLTPYLGQTLPLRYSTLARRIPSYVEENRGYNWGALESFLSISFSGFFEALTKINDDQLIFYGNTTGSVEVTPFLKYWTSVYTRVWTSSYGRMIRMEGYGNISITFNEELIETSLNGTYEWGSLKNSCKGPSPPLSILATYQDLTVFSDFQPKTSYIIYGNLSITESKVTLTKETTLVVRGCLLLKDVTLDVSNITENATLIEHEGCVEGDFTKVILPLDKKARIEYKPKGIFLLFDVSPSENIAPEESEEYNLALYIGVSVGAFVILVCIGVILAFTFSKKLRARIAPFHDRKHYNPAFGKDKSAIRK